MTTSSNKILILGSTGMIGNALLRLFSTTNFQVLSPSHKELNLENQSQVFKYFDMNKPQTVINAAGVVGGIKANLQYPYELIKRNLLILSNVAEAAERVEVSKVVLFGSSCLYPKHCKQPMMEEFIGLGQMEATSSAYSSAKLASIELGMAYNKQFNSERYLCVIPNSTHGPFDNYNEETGHVVASLITKFHNAKINEASEVTLWGTGTPCREFIYADDVAMAVKFLLDINYSTTNRPINIGIGKDISIKELARMIIGISGYKGKIVWDGSKPDGSPKKLLDSSRIFDLGWRPSYQLEEGLAMSYRWYEKFNL